MHYSTGRRSVAATLLGATIALQVAETAQAWTAGFGHVSAADRRLRPGCHDYRYHYVARPRSNDWMLETWLRDPRHRPRGSGDFAAGSDPKRGYAHFGICRSTVVPGRFTIRARLTWWTPGALPTDPEMKHVRWFRPAHFRLHR